MQAVLKGLPPALVLFGAVGPKIGRLFGKRDRQFILEQLQNTLAARIEPELQLGAQSR